MEIIIASSIVFGLIVLPLYLRSDMALVLGALAFGWVLNDITGNEVMLYGRSLVPVSGDLERIFLFLVTFVPALAAVLLTKKKSKTAARLVLNIGLAPAMFVTAWLLVRASLPLVQARSLVDSSINQEVIKNQEYALWMGAIFLLMITFLSRRKKSSEEKSKKK